MTALASTRRHRTMVMLAINLVALLALGGMGYAGYRALRRYEGGKDVSVKIQELPRTPIGALATVDGDNLLTSVTVFVLTPPGAGQVGGSIVTVPVSSDVALGIDGLRVPLTESYRDGGLDGLWAAVESVLSITIDQFQVATAAETAVLLAPVASATVQLPDDVIDTKDDGEAVTLYEAGEADLSAAQLAEVLTADRTGSLERTRRPNIEALWTGVAAAIGAGRTQVAADAPILTLADIVNRLFAGSVGVRGLTTVPLSADDNPQGKDVETLDRADAVFVFASIAPGSTSAPTTGLVYRIEAPPGYDEQVKYAVTLVLYFGQNVQSVFISDSIPVQDDTIFELYDADFRERTGDAENVFGDIVFRDPTVRVSGVEVVIRLGTSFLEADTSSGSSTLPATTTSTTEA